MASRAIGSAPAAGSGLPGDLGLGSAGRSCGTAARSCRTGLECSRPRPRRSRSAERIAGAATGHAGRLATGRRCCRTSGSCRKDPRRSVPGRRQASNVARPSFQCRPQRPGSNVDRDHVVSSWFQVQGDPASSAPDVEHPSADVPKGSLFVRRPPSERGDVVKRVDVDQSVVWRDHRARSSPRHRSYIASPKASTWLGSVATRAPPRGRDARAPWRPPCGTRRCRTRRTEARCPRRHGPTPPRDRPRRRAPPRRRRRAAASLPCS